jgi:hypothetical protein
LYGDPFFARYTVSNDTPVASCRTVSVPAGPECTADASIDAGSYDPDSDQSGAPTLQQSPPGPYGLGATPVTLTVTDAEGAVAVCSSDVLVQDTTPPALSVAATPTSLWPPNHQMIEIEVSLTAEDNCSAPEVLLIAASSSEPDDDPGPDDGNTAGDIRDAELLTTDLSFRLRAERDAAGLGRQYNVIYRATDAFDNQREVPATFTVPLQGDPLAIRVATNPLGTVVSWRALAGAPEYDVIRGALSGIAETGDAIALGPVVCIEDDSSDESTLFHEDTEDPDPGAAFFYLVEFHDQAVSSTYGTDTAPKPRVPGPGACD